MDLGNIPKDSISDKNVSKFFRVAIGGYCDSFRNPRKRSSNSTNTGELPRNGTSFLLGSIRSCLLSIVILVGILRAIGVLSHSALYHFTIDQPKITKALVWIYCIHLSRHVFHTYKHYVYSSNMLLDFFFEWVALNQRERACLQSRGFRKRSLNAG